MIMEMGSCSNELPSVEPSKMFYLKFTHADDFSFKPIGIYVNFKKKKLHNLWPRV
jgi:hypothetical protein